MTGTYKRFQFCNCMRSEASFSQLSQSLRGLGTNFKKPPESSPLTLILKSFSHYRQHYFLSHIVGYQTVSMGDVYDLQFKFIVIGNEILILKIEVAKSEEYFLLDSTSLVFQDIRFVEDK